MRKTLGTFLAAVLFFSSGCSLNSLNGLINGSKLDLTGVDVPALIQQLSALLSGCGE